VTEARFVTTTTDELLERAQQRTNLSDFGPDGWQEGFEQCVAAIPVDIGDNDDQVRRVEEIVVERLVTRLRIESWYAEHGGEAEAHPIEGPLMILGTGRSGTTATHYLFALDPQFRYLRKWEIADPVPPPELATEHEDPRRPVDEVRGSVQHIATADGPTEDRKIHELSFRESGNVLGLPSYVAWWRHADHTAKFPYHEHVLRLLHSHRPPYRWLLKSPEDMISLVPLAEHYPDARFVMTHRDPVKVVPSACSVIAEHTRMRLPDWKFDPEEHGRATLQQFHDSATRAMEARALIGEDRFVDVGQPELQDDAVGVAERVYDFAGLKFEDSIRDAMATWSEGNRAGSRGEHRYSSEEFGLTDDEIREVFADYLDRFGWYCFPKG
jgi:hypothetical protein